MVFMADPPSLDDIFASTTAQKLSAARSRRHPDVTAEKPRDAILDALRLVGGAVAEDGFIFTPSGPKFVRKRGDFTFQFNIQSDRNNVAGQRAAVWVHVAVYSRAFTAWSRQHESEQIRPTAAFPLPVYVSQLGYLCEHAGWMEWDFADKAKRLSVAGDLTDCMRKGAFPVFAAFEGCIGDVGRLVDRAGHSPNSILAYLLSMGQAGLAEETLHRYFTQWPDLKDQFDRLHREFAEQGVQNYRSTIAHDLAAFAVATGYPWTA